GGAGAAITLQVHAEHADLTELLGELQRDLALLEPVADVGRHLVGDKRPYGVADVALLVGQLAVQAEIVARVEGGRGGRGRGHGGRCLLVGCGAGGRWASVRRRGRAETLIL